MPAVPYHSKSRRQDPRESGKPKKSGLAPEIEHDVVRVDKPVDVAGVPVRTQTLGEAGKSGAEDRVVTKHLERRRPQLGASHERVAWVVEVHLDGDARGDVRDEQ